MTFQISRHIRNLQTCVMDNRPFSFVGTQGLLQPPQINIYVRGVKSNTPESSPSSRTFGVTSNNGSAIATSSFFLVDIAGYWSSTYEVVMVVLLWGTYWCFDLGHCLLNCVRLSVQNESNLSHHSHVTAVDVIQFISIIRANRLTRASKWHLD